MTPIFKSAISAYSSEHNYKGEKLTTPTINAIDLRMLWVVSKELPECEYGIKFAAILNKSKS